MLTDKADIELLMRAAAYAKIPADQLKPEQPWKFEGKTAELLQMATEAINPAKAAQWRSEAGGSISLATQAAELGLQAHTKATKEDLLKHDPVAVIQDRAAKEQWEKDQLAAMEQAVEKIQTAKYGKPLDPNEQNFGGGWQGEAMRRNYELDKAMGGSWN